MTYTTDKLEQLLSSGHEYLAKSSEQEMCQKLSPEKWSKKEILGHLIDSGINNLQRFTEIQFENGTYELRNYNQNELVKANDYQNAETKKIVELWISLNHRISDIIKQQTEESLNYKIKIDIKNMADLRFLINDYVEHLEHHLNQIMK